MKRITMLLVLLAAAAFVAAPALWAVDAPKDSIKLMVPEGAKATKPPVMFPHVPHAALECTACHHTWDGKAAVKKCKDSGCHDDTTTKKGDTSYYLSYHKKGKQSCLGCHKDLMKAKAEKVGPTSCNKCHVKK